MRAKLTNPAIRRGLPRWLAAIAFSLFLPSLHEPQVHRSADAQLKRRLQSEVRELLSAYNEQDRRTLGSAMVEQFIRRKDSESAAELAVAIGASDGYLFSRIAQTFVDAGNLRRAIQIASLPGDSAVRNAALTNLAASATSRMGVDAAREVIAAIEDSLRRRDVVLRVAQQLYNATPASAAFLREWLPLMMSDTTAPGMQRAGQFAAAMLMQRDLSGLRALIEIPDERRNNFRQLIYSANSLRSRGDPFADSAFAALKHLVSAEGAQTGAMLQLTFWQLYVPPGGDGHWRRTADSLSQQESKRAYLTAAARRRTEGGDYRATDLIADFLFQSGDTNTARGILLNTASTLAHGYSPYQSTPFSVPLRMVQRVMDTGRPAGAAGDDFTRQARALLPRLSGNNTRQVAQDPAFPQMDSQTQDATINALMSTDIQSALTLALMIPDTVRASAYLRSGAERLVNAGMVEAGLSIVARIRVPAQRVGPIAQAMQVKMQQGDTTGIRSMLSDVMQVIDFRRDNYQLSEMIVPVALKMDMLDDMLAWAKRLPFETRAFVLVAVLGKLGST